MARQLLCFSPLGGGRRFSIRPCVAHTLAYMQNQCFNYRTEGLRLWTIVERISVELQPCTDYAFCLRTNYFLYLHKGSFSLNSSIRHSSCYNWYPSDVWFRIIFEDALGGKKNLKQSVSEGLFFFKGPMVGWVRGQLWTRVLNSVGWLLFVRHTKTVSGGLGHMTISGRIFKNVALSTRKDAQSNGAIKFIFPSFRDWRKVFFGFVAEWCLSWGIFWRNESWAEVEVIYSYVLVILPLQPCVVDIIVKK